MDPWHVVESLVLTIFAILSASAGFVSTLIRTTVSEHGKRIAAIESTIYTREDASKGRAELKAELKQDIAEVRDQMTEQHDRMFDRLDTIVDRLPPKGTAT